MIRVALLTLLLTACATLPPLSPDLRSFPARPNSELPDSARLIVRKPADYPEKALRIRQEGWVVLSGVLDHEGWVRDPIVLESWPEGVFDTAALAAFSAWRYDVQSRSGSKPYEVRTLITFEIQRRK